MQGILGWCELPPSILTCTFILIHRGCCDVADVLLLSLGVILLTCVNALSYNVVHYLMIKHTSSVTTTVLGEMKIIAILLLSAVVLGEGRQAGWQARAHAVSSTKDALSLRHAYMTAGPLLLTSTDACCHHLQESPRSGRSACWWAAPPPSWVSTGCPCCCLHCPATTR